MHPAPAGGLAADTHGRRPENHLKAYGIAYWSLQREQEISWLLNFRGGSFAAAHTVQLEQECRVRGVTFEVLPDVRYQSILAQIADPEVNMDVVKPEKAPKIAVYSPKPNNRGTMP